MPFLRLSFHSELVGATEVAIIYPGEWSHMSTGVHLDGVLPQEHRPIPEKGKSEAKQRKMPDRPADLPRGGKYQCMYLLHGGGGNFMEFPCKTKLEEEFERSSLVVVMPHMLDYIDAKMDVGNYFQYLTEELPAYIQAILPVSPAREDNSIIGFSYGGYYAYYCGLHRPDKYGWVGSSCSPLYLMDDVREHHSDEPGMLKADDMPGSKYDLIAVIKKLLEDGKEIPALFQIAGTDDFTWEYNIKARDAFQKLDVDYTWMQGPGAHTYEFCDWSIRQFMHWMPLKKRYVMEEGDDV